MAIALFVQPRASKNSLCGLQGDELKVRLTSPPVEGAANKLCCTFFAKLLGVSKSSVTLIRGDKSRHKQIVVEGVSLDEVKQRLAKAF
ncbi:DUF167 family protein [uncultured Desulfuromonas sp.]|uniref:DUF167 domain-containing protein n=1 Tax=uncultured Desulfuromonas sp. TaxID=181013 RepID=UPI002AABE626|nr:DUF167 family protein [uncultured Desulfuromonas sp.]